MQTETTLKQIQLKEPRSKAHLITNSQLILHTDMANILVNGEWEYGQLGLLQFAQHIGLIWRAYKKDDPYAEWYLLRIFEAIQNTKDKFKNYEVKLQNQLSSVRGLEVDLFSNQTPFKQLLHFGTPFAFMVAMLIEQFDYLNRQLFTLNRLGLLPEEPLMPAHLMREVQAIYKLAREWKHTGVTRKDIQEGNQKAQQAKEFLGDLPEAVLKKEIQFAFLKR